MAIRDPRPYVRAYEGHPYCYGTRGWRMTAVNIAAKKKQYPGMAKYIPCEGGENSKNIGTDCIGLICAACSAPDTKGGPMGSSDTGMLYYSAKNGKGGNSFMDSFSAEGARASWGAKPISSIPEPTKDKPGIAVFMASRNGNPGHIGLYLGNGEVIESTPPRVQITKLKSRRTTNGSTRQWESWAYIPEKWLTWADSYFGATNSPAPEKPVQDPPEAQSDALKKDDKVRVIKPGVPYYPGFKYDIPDWLPKRKEPLSVTQVGTKGGVPAVLLGGDIQTWIAVEYVKKA